MTKVIFYSGLREILYEFVAFKKDFGHVYEKQVSYLKDFDRYCCEKFPNQRELSKDMVLGWACIRPSENSVGFISRLSPIRQFGKYLAIKGYKAFILPNGFKGNDMPKMPYIFTTESLKTFFTFTDNMEPYYQSIIRHLVAPVMFLFMYCCGLRPKEARNLRRNDLDFTTGRVFIQESKHYKERVIYATADLMQLIKRYLSKLEKIYPDSDALFLDRKGSAFTYSSQQYLFEHCRDMSGICGYGTKQPNLYSFRHTFATVRIYQWFKEGKDLDIYLPRLSAYMGHNSYENTLYYLHFVPEIFTEMTGYSFDCFSNLIPEVPDNE